jgi:hypothetical protein
MDISMPPDFPTTDFRAFAIAAQGFFPKLLSDEDLNDPQELRHFPWTGQAVRYRYRLCYDSSEEFSALLINPNEAWSKISIDEELSYRLERCIYVFFISGVSIFDSLTFCLYFFGNALRPANFRYVDEPKKTTLKATTSAFASSFGQANITERLRELSEQPEFTALEQWRNILAHRLAGRRSMRSSRTVLRDGTDESTRDERWYMPGPDQKLTFSEEMLRRQLQAITTLLVPLTSASRQFAENQSSVN